jgi:hypothetical protein
MGDVTKPEDVKPIVDSTLEVQTPPAPAGQADTQVRSGQLIDRPKPKTEPKTFAC